MTPRDRYAELREEHATQDIVEIDPALQLVIEDLAASTAAGLESSETGGARATAIMGGASGGEITVGRGVAGYVDEPTVTNTLRIDVAHRDGASVQVRRGVTNDGYDVSDYTDITFAGAPRSDGTWTTEGVYISRQGDELEVEHTVNVVREMTPEELAAQAADIARQREAGELDATAVVVTPHTVIEAQVTETLTGAEAGAFLANNKATHWIHLTESLVDYPEVAVPTSNHDFDGPSP